MHQDGSSSSSSSVWWWWMTVMVMVVAMTTDTILMVAAKPGGPPPPPPPPPGPHYDTSLKDFDNERTCWTGEACKMEFQSEFRCRCPHWYYCRSPGRYYHAYCTMSALGYIWIQPGGLLPEDDSDQ